MCSLAEVGCWAEAEWSGRTAKMVDRAATPLANILMLNLLAKNCCQLRLRASFG
jgi:hypothetical protein